MTYTPPPRGGFVENLMRVSHEGERRWKDESGRIYTWDGLHGEFEVFNRRGWHLGALGVDGRATKEPVKGRRIDV